MPALLSDPESRGLVSLLAYVTWLVHQYLAFVAVQED